MAQASLALLSLVRHFAVAEFLLARHGSSKLGSALARSSFQRTISVRHVRYTAQIITANIVNFPIPRFFYINFRSGIYDGLSRGIGQPVQVVVLETFGFTPGVVRPAGQISPGHIKIICEVLYAPRRPAGGHSVSGIAVSACHCTGGGSGGLSQRVFFGQFPDACGVVEFDLRIVSVGIYKVFGAYTPVLGSMLHTRYISCRISGCFQEVLPIRRVFLRRSRPVVRIIRENSRRSVGVVRPASFTRFVCPVCSGVRDFCKREPRGSIVRDILLVCPRTSPARTCYRFYQRLPRNKPGGRNRRIIGLGGYGSKRRSYVLCNLCGIIVCVILVTSRCPYIPGRRISLFYRTLNVGQTKKHIDR